MKQGHYVIDLGSGNYGVLPQLDFQGATKRNKPNLKIGSLVYTKVKFYDAQIEPLLTCMSDKNPKEWNTLESKYGELKDGYEI